MYWILILFTVFAAQFASAYSVDKSEYYGKDFLGQVQSGQLQNATLLAKLHQIIQTNHKALGYDRARKVMFGTIHLEQLADGTYAVKDVYCEKHFTDKDFNGGHHIGPGMVPGNGSILNTEHTWPQSRFTSRYDKETQKSDIHHLFPTDSQMNSHRSSLQFGNVDDDMEKLKCPQNRLGRQNGEKGTVFEPPVAHRGNVARAIFYFSVRYKMKVSGAEERALRRWNKEDPVNADEEKRNNIVEDAQGNRNPFVDYPELVDRINSFTFTTTVN